MLHPMREDPPPDFKCKDKFLVQSVEITAELETVPLPELWSLVDAEKKGLVHEHKLRTVYAMPTEESLNRESVTAAVPSGPGFGNTSLMTDMDTLLERKGDDKGDVLRSELEKANEIIRQLRTDNEKRQRELDEARSSLRRRTGQEVSNGDSKAAPRTKQSQQDVLHVPVHVVLIVGVISFIIGYWFF